MKRIVTSLSAALLLLALALTLFHSHAGRTVRAADANEKCDDCTVRNYQRFEQCVAVHGEQETRCYEQYNEGVVICFRNFCEQ